MRTPRLDVLRKFSPAFRWTFHKSPSTLMMPFPEMNELTEIFARAISQHSPNRSRDRPLKNSPLAKMPSCLNTYSRFLGSLMMTPGGKLGTEICNVS